MLVFAMIDVKPDIRTLNCKVCEDVDALFFIETQWGRKIVCHFPPVSKSSLCMLCFGMSRVDKINIKLFVLTRVLGTMLRSVTLHDVWCDRFHIKKSSASRQKALTVYLV